MGMRCCRRPSSSCRLRNKQTNEVGQASRLPTGDPSREKNTAGETPAPLPEQVSAYSGQRALARTDKGLAQDFFTGADQPLLVGKGDILFAYVYLDPANPP